MRKKLAPRPAPDIFYDYQLALAEPYLDEFSASGLPQKVFSMVAVPGTNEVWVGLEKNLNKKISVEGRMLWGYAESKYFEIEAIKSD